MIDHLVDSAPGPSYLVEGTEFQKSLDVWKAKACVLRIEPAESKSGNIIHVAGRMLVVA